MFEVEGRNLLDHARKSEFPSPQIKPIFQDKVEIAKTVYYDRKVIEFEITKFENLFRTFITSNFFSNLVFAHSL
jgi:hypothetical protein